MSRLLVSPGLWVPVGLLVFSVTAVLLLRQRFGRVNYALDPAQLALKPSHMTRLVTGQPERVVDFANLTRVKLLRMRWGAFLVLFRGEDDPEPIRFPLAHGSAGEVLATVRAATPASIWDPQAARLRDVLLATGDPGNPRTQVKLGAGDRTTRFCEASGLWSLAAQRLWPALLAQPTDRRLAGRLHRVEQVRLPGHARLQLTHALLLHHPGDPAFLMDLALVALALRMRKVAGEALDRLVSLDDTPAVAIHLRTALREHRGVPAPPSRAPLGIEINLPDQRLEGGVLITEGRFRTSMEWYVGYRVLPGFWGPPRALQLLDVWGARRQLRGDPVIWAARLDAAGPHLSEIHDEGLIWPPVGRRIRTLRRLA